MTKTIEVSLTSPGGTHVVTLLRPFSIVGKRLNALEAEDLAIAWMQHFSHLGLESVIHYV